jgi:phospholipase C
MLPGILRCRWRSTTVDATSIALLSCGLALAEDHDADDAHKVRTATPIKHVIILIGENWSFDSMYGTYKPKQGQRTGSLL